MGFSQEEVGPEWTKDFEKKIADYAISDDGNYIVVGTVSGNLYIFNSTGEEVLKKKKTGQIKRVSISDDGSYIAMITDFPHKWYLYNNSGTELIGKTYDYYSNPIKDISISKGKIPSIAVYNTGKITVYNTSGKRILNYLISEPDIPDSILFEVSSFGNTLVYCHDNLLRILTKYKVKKPVGTYKDRNSFIYGLPDKCSDISITKEGNYVLAGAEDGSIYFLDLTRIDDEKKLYFLWKQKSGGKVTQSKIIDNDRGEYSTIISSLDGNVYVFDSTGDIKNTYRSGAPDSKLSSTGGYITITDDDMRLEFYKIDTKENVVILANLIDYPRANGLFDFLENNDFKTIHASADDIKRYKKEKFIIILGGPDAPDGIGEIVQEVLMLPEQNSIREKGAMKMFVKTNVWSMGQKVIVLAGSGRNETQKAHEENRDNQYFVK